MQQPPTDPELPRARPRLGERLLTAVSRDPLTVPHRQRNDAVIAAGTGVLAVVLALVVKDGRQPDVLGWALLAGSIVPLAWRRRRPLLVLLAVLACIGPYHAFDNTHFAPVPGSLLALYTVATILRPLHTMLIGTGVIGIALTVMFRVNTHQGLESLRTSGWILAVLVLGVDVRVYRRYIASVVGRAERAERTREEEAARRVAEERLRIARDLHDLLAHSITLIGVQTSVAAHVLAVDPDRLDRAAIAKALDDIADTCRTARGELRTTLEVLRADGPDGPEPHGPLPDLRALPGLVRAANADLTVRTGEVRLPPAVEAAAYRIVQESLTNAVRHGGSGVQITVAVQLRGRALDVTVTDDGTGPGETGGSGYGIVGMRERARSVGGTLSAGPRDGGGFVVAAVLPLQPSEALA
ncbi:sensor histidine kinase [Streptomyces sp. NBC_01142]|uniref:sensor histidine kinase n=1 Tax=Streptomyces sp. NBC_01142 TaxID=2975865 RepID=UPI00225A7678|nr:sensor histidine kinase [Streptomyces sp. NBC_01142]MCX4822966.1 sensor histidine kinase [Streptomyces sp. NBC_01142]